MPLCIPGAPKFKMRSGPLGKRLRGTTKIWNLAVSLDGVWGATPGQAAELEKRAWEKFLNLHSQGISAARTKFLLSFAKQFPFASESPSQRLIRNLLCSNSTRRRPELHSAENEQL